MANMPSRFLEEVPDELKQNDSPARSFGFGYSRYGDGAAGGSGGFGYRGGSYGGRSASAPSGSFGGVKAAAGAAGGSAKPAGASPGGAANETFAPGDKVNHVKWGVGTVVAVKGEGSDRELQIAFPAPVGVKRLLAAFAPITKV